MSDTPEAPASMNVRFASTLGYEYLLTVRSFAEENPGAELLNLIPDVEKALQQFGCRPIFGKNSQAAAPAKEKPKGWCPIHDVQMKRHEKDGQTWYSHKDDTTNGEWCNGKEKKS
jgi:hypothetical protein